MAVGLFTLAFTAGYASVQIGINVVSGNGFIPFQAQTFNYLAIFFGFLLSLVSLAAWQLWSNRSRAPQKADRGTATSVGGIDGQIGLETVS
jgi:cytosine/uracil/thiamine/allantoin permease